MQQMRGQARLGARSSRASVARSPALRCFAAVAVSQKAATRPPFPFVKIAGQDEMKLALLLNVVDPNIGGVLVMGDRGTGKSIAVRVGMASCSLGFDGPSPMLYLATCLPSRPAWRYMHSKDSASMIGYVDLPLSLMLRVSHSASRCLRCCRFARS